MATKQSKKTVVNTTTTITVDLSTVEGRLEAVQTFNGLMSEAMKNNRLQPEEAYLGAYKEDTHMCGGVCGNAGEVAELQAHVIAEHPEILKQTMTMAAIIVMQNKMQSED